ncbi:MAG: SDR family oxidoreductase [Phenylobacterium sp.]|uniref:SDR family oxidoreductase n=1 Tax=Phenylobacterium sp. TaxID=1871053 RepID=UPI002735027D|nr:SDR family oxidoreductase [Phenylobacterium sp.]MDP3173373.1 SDR family oxidoreductase [Phenylobacterium sp.]
MKQFLILGGTGDVGSGVIAALLDAGHSVLATSRGGPKAEALRNRHAGRSFHLIEGSVHDEAAAATLLQGVRARVDRVDGVLAGLSGARPQGKTLVEWSSADLLAIVHANLITHFVAAKTFVPIVVDGGIYIGLGGAMADRIFPHYSYNSMIQSAQRTMFRYLDHELENHRIAIRELIIGAMVTTEDKAKGDDPKYNWITDREVSEHIRAMLENPADFPGPIEHLFSARGVGRSRPVDPASVRAVA